MPYKSVFLLRYIDLINNFAGCTHIVIQVSLSDFSYCIYKSHKETYTYNEQHIRVARYTGTKIVSRY